MKNRTVSLENLECSSIITIILVRICALKTIEAVVEKLGDDYQNLLHESAPFLAELLEDDDENVERKIHETVKYLEDVFKDEISKTFTEDYRRAPFLSQHILING